MNKAEVELVEKLNLFDWYVKLVLKNTCAIQDMLRKPERKMVEKILGDLGYCCVYYPESKVYGISTKYAEIEFYCNPQLQNGDVRVHLFAQKGNHKVGGNLISTCRMYEIAKGKDSGKYLLSPRFRDYTQLRDILKEVLDMYEKFKVAIIEEKTFDKLSRSE